MQMPHEVRQLANAMVEVAQRLATPHNFLALKREAREFQVIGFHLLGFVFVDFKKPAIYANA